jgi:hypothetical protein
VKEELVVIQACFECEDHRRCGAYAAAYRKHPSEVESLRKAWDGQEPEIEIVIRRKRMPEKKEKQAQKSTVPRQQMYYFVSKGSNDAKEIQEIGGEDRILQIVKTGGQIVRIYRLGDEQEVVIKIQKKMPTT